MKATRDNVIVKKAFEEHKGLIQIPDTAQHYKQYAGAVISEVVAVGPGYPYKISPGAKVIVRRHEGVKFTYQGVDYWKTKERWVEARLEE